MAKSKHTKGTASEKTKQKKKSRDKGLVIDYDGIWKKIISEFFPDFINFFLPNLYTRVDWNIPPEFLEQELELLHKELEINRKITDKLVKVKLVTGEERWILIHLEVQTGYEIDFAARMYLYNALIYAKFKQPIVALAIFTAKDIPEKFDKYEQYYFGTHTVYKYNTYCIVNQKEADLLKIDNIFSLFVLANLYILQTKNAYPKRLELKEKLFELAVDRNIPKHKIERLLIFVNQILLLPLNLQTLFMEKVVLKKSRRQKQTFDEQFEAEYRAMMRAFFIAESGMTPEKFLEIIITRDVAAGIAKGLAEAEASQSEALQNAFEEMRKTEAEKQKMETEKQKAEAEKQKMEAEKQKAEAEKQKAEAEKTKAEAEKT
ncbi:MAG: hypothetical protein RLZZ628_4266, partial [Bacteroidota bacterium]